MPHIRGSAQIVTHADISWPILHEKTIHTESGNSIVSVVRIYRDGTVETFFRVRAGCVAGGKNTFDEAAKMYNELIP